MVPNAVKHPDTEKLSEIMARFPQIRVAALFGSMARGTARPDSDIDVAVQADKELSADERIAITEAIALAFNRPVDLVDLRTAGQPLLDQIVSTGKQVVGTRHQWGDLIYRNIMENEDFVPYQKRILEGRRNAWMNNS
ncbi:type VII toxin-antitoxin system MntA family adenylyltransferase antitoxin [Marinobacter shengliensis]|uniref:type VII toxin-antitoxin system MntA family adenylyltransferase antitoxin n=1 Tax=Marinobacter shengliensis TaxID=1389223 RepID=UPI000D10F6B9|nr:nucleotidyltransferase domain-containing protein [Marinobacter shengliensis]PSF12650.1 DNA polymerase III subunit beta [Marinobacter shengliensis]